MAAWKSKRMRRLLVLSISLWALLTAFAVVAVKVSESRSPRPDSPPWVEDGFGTDSLANLGVVALVVMGAAALWGAITGWARGTRPANSRKGRWRYRDMSRGEKRRLAIALVISCQIAAIPAAIYMLNGGSSLGVWGRAAWVVMGGGTLGMLTGFAMVLIQVRPSRTVMQIVEERTKDDAKAVLGVLAEMRAEDARQMEIWKSETIADLYAMIMGQVESGLISCEKCKEVSAATVNSVETPPIPEPRNSEDVSKPCECGGPTSIRVIYPPRFQEKRTAS